MKVHGAMSFVIVGNRWEKLGREEQEGLFAGGGSLHSKINNSVENVIDVLFHRVTNFISGWLIL